MPETSRPVDVPCHRGSLEITANVCDLPSPEEGVTDTTLGLADSDTGTELERARGAKYLRTKNIAAALSVPSVTAADPAAGSAGQTPFKSAAGQLRLAAMRTNEPNPRSCKNCGGPIISWHTLQSVMS